MYIHMCYCVMVVATPSICISYIEGFGAYIRTMHEGT